MTPSWEPLQPRPAEQPSSSRRYQRCGKCSSTHNQQRDWTEGLPTGAHPNRSIVMGSEQSGHNSIVKVGGKPCPGEPLDERFGQLTDELTKAELERMKTMHQSNTSSDAVSGSLGHCMYYTTVSEDDTQVEAMVEPGLIISNHYPSFQEDWEGSWHP